MNCRGLKPSDQCLILVIEINKLMTEKTDPCLSEKLIEVERAWAHARSPGQIFGSHRANP